MQKMKNIQFLFHVFSWIFQSRPGQAASEEMKEWSKKVAQNGVYLEFGDLFLLCSMHGIRLKIVSYAEGTEGFVTDFFETIRKDIEISMWGSEMILPFDFKEISPPIPQENQIRPCSLGIPCGTLNTASLIHSHPIHDAPNLRKVSRTITFSMNFMRHPLQVGKMSMWGSEMILPFVFKKFSLSTPEENQIRPFSLGTPMEHWKFDTVSANTYRSVNCLPEGHQEQVDATEWLKQTVPDFELDRGLEEEMQYTAAAVLCRADYSQAQEILAMNHWVPALPIDQVANAGVALEEWAGAARDSWNDQLEILESRRKGLEDVELDISIETEMELQKLSLENFLKMQKFLYDSQGLLARHVIGDGNCGIYMMLALIKDVPMHEVTAEEAAALRRDLQVLWYQLSSVPMYQKLWNVLRQFRATGDEPPEHDQEKGQKDQNEEPDPDPFTPDKAESKKRLLPTTGVLAGFIFSEILSAFGFTSCWKIMIVPSHPRPFARQLGDQRFRWHRWSCREEAETDGKTSSSLTAPEVWKLPREVACKKGDHLQDMDPVPQTTKSLRAPWLIFLQWQVLGWFRPTSKHSRPPKKSFLETCFNSLRRSKVEYPWG